MAAVPAWQPAPVTDAGDPAEIIAKAAPDDWREVLPENLLILDLKDGSRVAIELAPEFAPVHVANIRLLARHGWWRDSAIYRVQDNYVVQWGQNENQKADPPGLVAVPPAEYERDTAGLKIRPLGYPDSYAPRAGHAEGWPVGYDEARGRAWLTHCYAMVGVARDLAPDTGRGGELYAVIGHAPRHLDRNIALVGRVLGGMETLSSRSRGSEPLGFYKYRGEDVPIEGAIMAADIAEAERPKFEVLRTESPAFAAYVTARANRSGPFFTVPAGGIDICNAPVPARRKN